MVSSSFQYFLFTVFSSRTLKFVKFLDELVAGVAPRMKAILVDHWQDPNELKVVETEEPKVSEGMVLIDVKVAGANFFDILMVQGKYQTKPKFPFIPGSEFSGDVIEVGDGVDGFKKGDKVYGTVPYGSYAERWLLIQIWFSICPRACHI